MDAKKELQNYKKIVDQKLAEYFAKGEKEARKISPLAVEALGNIRDLTLAGGKDCGRLLCIGDTRHLEDKKTTRSSKLR